MKSVNQNIIEKFNDLLGEEKVKVDEPMKRHTTFRIGGPADYFLLPSSEEELSGILKICKNEELPYFILGNGSNLLVSDEGYRGVIIQLYRNYGDITVKGNEIHATAGALLSQMHPSLLYKYNFYPVIFLSFGHKTDTLLSVKIKPELLSLCRLQVLRL